MFVFVVYIYSCSYSSKSVLLENSLNLSVFAVAASVLTTMGSYAFDPRMTRIGGELL